MTLTRTNNRQFEVEILGLRRPALGEVFEIEVGPRRERYEVECVDRHGSRALVERTDDGPPVRDARSRVISDRRSPPPDMPYGHKASAHRTTREIVDQCQAIRDEEDYDDMMNRTLDQTLDSMWQDEWQEQVENDLGPDPYDPSDPYYAWLREEKP